MPWSKHILQNIFLKTQILNNLNVIWLGVSHLASVIKNLQSTTQKGATWLAWNLIFDASVEMILDHSRYFLPRFMVLFLHSCGQQNHTVSVAMSHNSIFVLHKTIFLIYKCENSLAFSVGLQMQYLRPVLLVVVFLTKESIFYHYIYLFHLIVGAIKISSYMLLSVYA